MARIITPDFSKSQGSFLDDAHRYDRRHNIRIEYTDRLLKYLDTQKNKDILIAAYRPHGHMAVAEENVQLINSDFADELAAAGTPYIVTEVGRVLISNTWIPESRNPVIQLDLTHWLGVKAISAKGLRRQDVLRPFAPIYQRTD